jgi:hypothetical protein
MLPPGGLQQPKGPGGRRELHFSMLIAAAHGSSEGGSSCRGVMGGVVKSEVLCWYQRCVRLAGRGVVHRCNESCIGSRAADVQVPLALSCLVFRDKGGQKTLLATFDNGGVRCVMWVCLTETGGCTCSAGVV